MRSSFILTTCALLLGAMLAAADQSAELVPLTIELPKASFQGTPSDLPSKHLEAPRVGQRPSLMVPKGCVNLAIGKIATSSERELLLGDLGMLTDEDKQANPGSYIELGFGIQWIQVDLGAPATIDAIALWHYHSEPRVYRAVVVQVADDPDCTVNVRTLFNNDTGNLVGRGAGTDAEYVDTYEGKLIEAKSAVGRYVRCYSRGYYAHDANDQTVNHYTELEVWGRPQ